MRIVFVSDIDPYDRAAFSGTTYQILQMILATGAKVEVIGPIMERWRFNLVRLSTIPHRVMGHGVAWPKHPFLLQACAQKVDAAARRLQPDVIFSPGSNAIAYSGFIKPTIFWSDAPFAAMADYYPWPQFQNLTPQSRAFGMNADTRALRYSTCAIYRSNWGREAAIRLHDADPARVEVVPLPGNLYRRWSEAEILELIPPRLQYPWKLFFSGVEWERKGGNHTIEILNELIGLSQPCELYVAGTVVPPEAMARAKFPIHSLGRLDLNDPDNRVRLGKILEASTFLVVPSTAEALGIVFCEALSAGVPAVGNLTGGVPDVVLDGKTGILIAPGETPRQTALRMIDVGRDERIYTPMALAGWKEWNARFANSAVLAKLTQILNKAADAGRAAA